eukprot:1137729-Pelagomonas_calceolata.AAC.2
MLGHQRNVQPSRHAFACASTFPAACVVGYSHYNAGEKGVAMVTMVTMGFDLQPGSLAAQVSDTTKCTRMCRKLKQHNSKNGPKGHDRHVHPGCWWDLLQRAYHESV